MSIDFEKKDVDPGELRFGIVTARWNSALTKSLERAAVRGLTEAGVDRSRVTILEVPGAFELPLASQKLAQTGVVDAVIALGAVIRGDTPHFDFVAGEAAAGIMQANLTTGVPIIFGVITVNTLQQAEDRAGDGDSNKGYEAAVSALEMASLICGLSSGKEQRSVAS